MIDWLKPEDIDSLIQIHQSISHALENPSFFSWSREAFLNELEISKTLIFKIESRPVSFISFRETSENLEIMMLGTGSSQRNKGIMSELVRQLQTYAAKQNKKVYLEVHEQNQKALSLYAKLGFQFSHTRKNYYPDQAGARQLTWSFSGCV